MKVEIKIGSEWYEVTPRHGTNATQGLNEKGQFTLITSEGQYEREVIQIDREIRITQDNFIFGGVIRNIKRRNGQLEVDGLDYTYLADKILINKNNTALSDPASTTYDVIYINQMLRNILIDMTTNSGLIANTASVDNFGTSGLNIRFKRTYLGEGLRKLAEISGYEWRVDSNKVLYLKQSISSTSPVCTFDLLLDKLVSDTRDENKLCNRATVFGSEGSQAIWEDVTSIAQYGLHEGRFRFPELNTDSACLERAKRVISQFKDIVRIITIQTRETNFMLGDRVSLVGQDTDGVYRITRIRANVDGAREVQVTDLGKQHREEEVYEVINKYISGQQDIADITFGDEVGDLTFTHADASGVNRDFNQRFYIDPNEITDVLKATIGITRENLPKTYGDSTGSSLANIGAYAGSRSISSSISSGGSSSIIVQNIYESNGRSIRYGGGWYYDVLNFTMSSTATAGMLVTLYAWRLGSTSATAIDLRLYSSGLGDIPSNGLRSEVFRHSADSSAATAPVTFYVPYNVANRRFEVDIRIPLSYSTSSETWIVYAQVYTLATHIHDSSISPSSHDHTVGVNDYTHANSLNFNVADFDSGGSRSVQLIVNGNNRGTFNLSSIGSQILQDISSYVTTGWNTITLRPSDNTYLQGNVNVKVFRNPQ